MTNISVFSWIEIVPKFAEIIFGSLLRDPCSFWDVLTELPDMCNETFRNEDIPDGLCVVVSEVVDLVLSFKVSESLEVCQNIPEVTVPSLFLP